MWLLREGDVLAALEVAGTRRARRRGLLGRDGIDGGLLLRGVRLALVHTIGMRFPIDVAYCDHEMRVLATTSMRPFRVGMLRLRARNIIEAEAGAFARWRLAVGDVLEVKG
jgi:uncharacterized membrane protein (UPF0127 family)